MIWIFFESNFDIFGQDHQWCEVPVARPIVIVFDEMLAMIVGLMVVLSVALVALNVDMRVNVMNGMAGSERQVDDGERHEWMTPQNCCTQ